MAIAKHKQRYSVTLTPANVHRLQAIMAKIGLPPSTMSNFIDDQLPTLAATFEAAYAKGSMEISDLFVLLGNQMKLIEDEKEVVKNDQKKIHGGTKKTTAI